MKLSKQQLADIFDDAADFDGSNEEAFDARKALEAGTLEIEGYERSEWVKFNPNDPKTFPQKKDGRMFMVHQIYNGESIFNIATSNTYWWGKCNVTHWRPLPPSPVETEVKK